MKQTIIFDLGGVLIDWDPRYLYRKIFPDREEMNFFLKEICSLEWHVQMDGEKSFIDAINELISLHPEYSDQIRAYFERWEEMIGGEIPGTVNILQELKDAGYPLAAISNWSSETFPIVNAKYEFLDWFNPQIISGQVGLVKPDPDIYHLTLCQIDRDPTECLFIDDVKENIKAAADIGIETILFSSPQQLRNELMARGILSEGS